MTLYIVYGGIRRSSTFSNDKATKRVNFRKEMLKIFSNEADTLHAYL